MSKQPSNEEVQPQAPHPKKKVMKRKLFILSYHLFYFIFKEKNEKKKWILEMEDKVYETTMISKVILLSGKVVGILQSPE